MHETPPVAAPGVLPDLVRQFQLGSVGECRYLSQGLMNRNWRLESEQGTFVLKEFHDASMRDARRNLEAVTQLHTSGIPVPLPVRSSSGDLVVAAGSQEYCLFPWVHGEHRPGTELSLSESRYLGASIGRLHRAMNANCRLPEAERPKTTVVTPEAAAAAADRFVEIIADKPAQDDFDRAAVLLLSRRVELIGRYGDHRPGTTLPEGPYGWTHGDLQYRNLLWSGERLAAFLDWDRVRVRPFAEEVARTATVLFGGEAGYLDLERIAAFAGGYRSEVEISASAMADGVHRLWWKRASDYWPLVFHYDRADRSCDHFFCAGERLLSWWTDRLGQVESAFTAQ